MTDPAKNVADVILGSLQLFALIAGGGWALWRFFKERSHAPRFDVSLECNLFGPQGGFLAAEFIVTMRNHGTVKHIVNDAFLRVRGLPRETPLQVWANNGQRLEFPVRIFEDNVIYKKKFSHVFAEPGVSQPLTYVACVPDSFTLLLARADFNYDGGESLSVERVFAVHSSSLRPIRHDLADASV